MKLILGLFAGLIVLLLAIIGVQNPTPVTLQFLVWQTGILPLWVVIAAALGSGLLLGGVWGVPGRISRTLTTRRLRHQLAAATPVKDSEAIQVVAPSVQPPTLLATPSHVIGERQAILPNRLL